MTLPVRMILFASAVTVLGIAIATAQTGAITALDGDTIKVDGVSSRLMGFNTPETYYAKCEEEYRLGIIASVALQKLINDAKQVSPT